MIFRVEIVESECFSDEITDIIEFESLSEATSYVERYNSSHPLFSAEWFVYARLEYPTEEI